ncbi:hypothetical protein M9H77_36368 [Catharanthus roseus]|uniref:Uncharacterized protein n=1 Tax=Catharanthus roseus TaxID=4058 RepID=A0ACB9ZTJ7_CATRO|nr:hypothetical protein M9H77_36368 [Catharanthus roseus]
MPQHGSQTFAAAQPPSLASVVVASAARSNSAFLQHLDLPSPLFGVESTVGKKTIIFIQQVVSEPKNDHNFSVLSSAPATNRTSQYSRSEGIVEFRRSSSGNHQITLIFYLKHVDSKNLNRQV